MGRLFQLGLLALSLLTVGCAKDALSERDAKLNQAKNAAEAKRRELQPVVGFYTGALVLNGNEQEMSLTIEIKDIPTPVEGSVDPVMVPTLSGYIKLTLGSYAITKADFSPKTNKLDFVGSHVEFKDLIVSADVVGPDISGTWTAPSLSASGTLKLSRVTSL
jgi:hypothetical protein